MLRIAKILICSVAFVSQVAYAEITLSANGIDDKGAESAKDLPVRPVEVGAGGNIKQEREFITKVESQFKWHGHLLWESRYVTEGRDNLSGKSLASISTEFTFDDLSIVPWIAHNSTADYSEFNLNIVYGTGLTEALTLYAGYTHIRADDSGEKASDHEISLDLDYIWHNNINLLASLYHSFDADGSFVEFSLNYSGELSSQLHYSLSGIFGVNAGYVVQGHTGPNHVQLRAKASYFPLAQMELSAYAGYTQAIDRDPQKYADDALLKDFAWGGVGMTYLF